MNITQKGRYSPVWQLCLLMKDGSIVRPKSFMRKKMLNKIWIYKKDQKPKTILLKTYQQNLENLNKSGWSDWPSFSPEQFGFTAADNLDELGDIIKTVQTSLNQALNIETLDHIELMAYARDGLALKIDHLDDVESMRDKVREAM